MRKGGGDEAAEGMKDTNRDDGRWRWWSYRINEGYRWIEIGMTKGGGGEVAEGMMDPDC